MMKVREVFNFISSTVQSKAFLVYILHFPLGTYYRLKPAQNACRIELGHRSVYGSVEIGKDLMFMLIQHNLVSTSTNK